MYFLMTNDVEAHSISLNREDPLTVELVCECGMRLGCHGMIKRPQRAFDLSISEGQ